MVVDSPREYIHAHGYRPMVKAPDPQWLTGPFFIDISLLNATAMAKNLCTRDTWYTDIRVRNAYSLSSSDTSPMLTTLHLDRIGLLIAADDNDMAFATKLKLWLKATAPYLRGKIKAIDWYQYLIGKVVDPAEQFQITQTTAATGEFGILRGKIAPLDTPVRIDMFRDSLSLISDAAVALGADTAAYLVLDGCLFPNNIIGGAHPGAACGDQDPADDQVAGPATVQAIAALDTQATALYPSAI